MTLTTEQIHAKLAASLGEALAPYEAPEAGDPSIAVAADMLHEACALLRDDPELAFDLLRLVTGVDWTDRFTVVYHLFSLTHHHELTLKAELDHADPRVASVADLWPAADWHERETWDLMGIHFEGHPNLRRILLPEDWDGHPLRKDYTPPEEYHGIPNG